MTLLDRVLKWFLVSAVSAAVLVLGSEAIDLLRGAELRAVFEAIWYERNPVGSQGWWAAKWSQTLESFSAVLVLGGVVWGAALFLVRPSTWLGGVVAGCAGFMVSIFVLALLYGVMGIGSYEETIPEFLTVDGIVLVLQRTVMLAPSALLAGVVWGSADRLARPLFLD